MPAYSNNYSKWDALEVSDDSDIEGHPNVDHRSLVMWKQRDIHERREARKQRVAEYEATIATNAVLEPRLQIISKELAEGGAVYFARLLTKLKENPSPETPPHQKEVTYDQMILSLLNKVFDEVVVKKGVPKDDLDKLGPALSKEFDEHMTNLGKVTVDAKKGLDEELAEQRKHITSDDIKVGWDSKYVPAPKEKVPEPAITPKAKTTTKTTTIETLNAPSASTSTTTPAPSPSQAAELFDQDENEENSDDDDSDIPHMTSSLTAFAQIPLNKSRLTENYEASFEFLQRDRGIFTDGAVDAMLLEAFHAETNGKKKYAEQCVHQGLMIQYCEKLGRDGIGMFFKKMISGNKQAIDVFEKDVEHTYAMIKRRAAANKEEHDRIVAQGGVEQIQLMPENPDTVISFDVPDGPPPADLRLDESLEAEGLDLEEVRAALQRRWDIFQGFDPKLQKALQSGKLDAVNKVLGKMPVDEAEQIVELLQIAHILQFAEGGIRDGTGRGKADEAASA